MKLPAAFSLLIAAGAAAASGAEAKLSLWDPDDGWFDLSAFLERKSGFYPMATPITEPAVGYGAAVVPIFIRLPDKPDGRPDLYAAGAMRTNNGTEAVFAGFSKYFAADRFHLLGGGLTASINLEFHGLGNEEISDDPLLYNLDITGGAIGGDIRLGDTHWRTGLRYIRAEVEAGFAEESAARLGSVDFDRRFGGPGLQSTISSLQALVNYDTRDNLFTPTRGLYSELSLMVNDEAIGGSTDYQLLNWTTLWYRPVVKKRLFLGLRGDVKQSFGEVPFYARPFVQLRGTPVMRYQGEGVALTEAELRWQFHPRWSLLGFGGAGATWTGEDPFRRTNSTVTGGGGFRYLVARRHGLQVGADVAWGEEGPAIYIQFGNAWFRP